MFRGLTSAGLVNHGADGGSAVQQPVAEPQQAPGVFTHLLGEAGLDVSKMRAAGAWAVFEQSLASPSPCHSFPTLMGCCISWGPTPFPENPAST